MESRHSNSSILSPISPPMFLYSLKVDRLHHNAVDGAYQLDQVQFLSGKFGKSSQRGWKTHFIKMPEAGIERSYPDRDKVTVAFGSPRGKVCDVHAALTTRPFHRLRACSGAHSLLKNLLIIQFRARNDSGSMRPRPVDFEVGEPKYLNFCR